MGVVVSAAVVVIAIISGWRSHTASTKQAERDLRIAASALADQAALRFQGAHQLLEQLQRKRRVDASTSFAMFQVESVGVVDPVDIAASLGRSGAPLLDCLPNDAVQFHTNSNSSEYLMKTGRCAAGGQHLFVTQRIENGRGEFEGVAYVKFSAAFLKDHLKKLGYDQDTSGGIFSRELQLLVGFAAPGNVAPLEKLRIQKVLSSDQSTVVTTLSKSKSGNTMAAFANVAGTAAIVGVDQAAQHYMAPWRESTTFLLLVVVLSIAGIAGAVGLLLRSIDNQRRAQTDLNIHKELQQIAEDASRSKSEYLAIMSHEIRTSMSGVLGMAEFMLRSKLYKEQHSGVRVLYEAGQNLVQIINKILDVSKIESGTLELSLAPFEPTDLVERVAELFSKEALNKGITLEMMKPGPAFWVEGDEFRIRQILANFVGNAMKFTKQGSVSIGLISRPAPGNVSRVILRFEVRDTGIGIPHALQSRLFQPFHQVDSSIAREFGGTGLGLSICKRLSDLMGGRVWVQSEAGKGSSFFFEIECARSVAATPASPTVDVDLEYDQTAERASILIVEDNASNLKIAKLYLERDGFKVTGALDGAEAIEQFRKGHFDVILMDGMMPLMDGYEATRRIRLIEAEEKRKRVPIIATTANTGKENEERCAAAGMDDFVPKPYRFSDLKVKIAQWAPPEPPR